MEKIIVVDHSEIVQGAKGEYLKVTDKGGKTQNIFDQALWNLFNDGLAVKLQLEKQGVYWNVMSAEAVSLPVETKTNGITPQEKGRNASFALSYAKDLACADKIPPDKILSYAEVFVRWLDGSIKVEDEVVFQALLKKTFNVV